MSDLARCIGQRNERLRQKAAPLAYALGQDTLGYDSPDDQPAAVDEQQRCATFCVASAVLDRDGDVVLPAGIDVGRWAKNPVWLWDHQTESLPLGMGLGPDGKLGWEVRGDKAYATCWFHDDTDFARSAWALVKRGVLKGTSIGFKGLKGQRVRTGLEAIDYPAVGWRFDSCELAEISLVNVPTNPDAAEVELLTKSLSVRPPPRRLYVAGWRPKSDTPVGRKISKLMGEGKKQDQAVAIALDMERRGELKAMKRNCSEDDPQTMEERHFRTAAQTPDEDGEDVPEGYQEVPELGMGLDEQGQAEPDADDMGGPSDMDADDQGPPGSQALQSISGGAQSLAAQINDVLPMNENPKVVKALQRALADLQDVADALDTLHGQEYGGGDDNMPPAEPASDTEEKGADMEGEGEEEDDEEKREKSLTDWRKRLARYKGWLERKPQSQGAGGKEEARRLVVIEQKLARLEAAAYRAFGLKAV